MSMMLSFNKKMKERKKTSANTEIWVVESNCNKKLNAKEVHNKQQ
jgi:hypothetical protein